jgi:hypothetical protein
MVEALDPEDADLDNPDALLDALPPALHSALRRFDAPSPLVDRANAYGLRSAFDRVIHHLTDEKVAARVRSITPDHPLRVALLSAGLSRSLIPELAETLAASPLRDADLLIAELSDGPSSRRRLARARFMKSLEFDDRLDDHPLAADADALDEAATTHGGHIGDLLHVLAAFALGHHDDERLLALVARCKRQLQEQIDERSS